MSKFEPKQNKDYLANYMQKEAKSRIKINNLLQVSGWRFFDDENGVANIVLENNVKLTKSAVDEFGNDFDKTKDGFIDFLLLDEKGFPYVVLEAKSEDKDPLNGKEQARRYAQSQNVRFIIFGIWNEAIRQLLPFSLRRNHSSILNPSSRTQKG